jgi:potassium-transporting ATPase KdpC subunit
MPALRATIFFTVLTGLIYPGLVTGLCQTLFRDKANGSLISRNGHLVGSALLGQNFSKPEYFHGRPSAAGANGYDATASGGSNLGPTSQKLHDRVKASAEQFHKENPTAQGPIPADAVTASASGLDPEISLDNAQAQLDRVAKARGTTRQKISQLIAGLGKGRDLGLLGEPRLNVLQANIALDEQYGTRK